MRTSIVLAVAGIVLLSQGAAAGWYQVDNYAGTIGDRTVQLSLQSYDFGSGLTLEGNLVSGDDDAPIALYGTRDGRTLSLCSIATPEQFDAVIIQGSTTPIDTSDCPFTLVLDGESLTGTLAVDDGSEAVALNKVATLDDTGTAVLAGPIQIPFWQHTDAHVFVGLYAQADTAICMHSLQVINRVTRAVDQEIAFDPESCNAGMVMTPIYLNVETGRDEAGAEQVSVNFADSRAGYAETYSVDPATGLLSLQPEE